MYLLAIFVTPLAILLLIASLFFLASKEMNWEEKGTSIFECGFTSYFFSRFSFSIHYFLIGLIFLFLDLELCLVMPIINNQESGDKLSVLLLFFLVLLILGLIEEWSTGSLEWTN